MYSQRKKTGKTYLHYLFIEALSIIFQIWYQPVRPSTQLCEDAVHRHHSLLLHHKKIKCQL